MNNTKTIPLMNKESMYGRDKSACLTSGACDGCGAAAEVLSMDSSDDEYGPVSLCQRCVEMLPWGEQPELLIMDGEGARTVDPTNGYVNDPNLPRFKFVEAGSPVTELPVTFTEPNKEWETKCQRNMK